MESVAGGSLQELVYIVMLNASAAPHRFLEALQRKANNNKATLVLGQQEVDL